MQAFSVSQFLDLANNALADFWNPMELSVEGEVTDFRISRGTWVNFSIKDDAGLLPVFMVAYKLAIPLEDGMKVRLYGSPRVYPKYGKFSFNADAVELVGEGDMQKALKELRKKLEAEGLFDPARKRSLPRFPRKIALIASTESAAYGDFTRIVNERWAGLEIDAYHVLVQGVRAPESVIRAIESANTRDYDALVITRGGGSLEDMMAFNDEGLVRAIYASKIPTVVGIGHERDVALAEEAADVRASTPTDCARRLVPDRQEVLYEIATMEQTVWNAVILALNEKRKVVEDAMLRAGGWIERLKSENKDRMRSVLFAAERWQEHLHERVTLLQRLSASFDPSAVLKRGYAYLTSDDRALVSVKQLSPGKNFHIHLQDGIRSATINKNSYAAEERKK